MSSGSGGVTQCLALGDSFSLIDVGNASPSTRTLFFFLLPEEHFYILGTDVVKVKAPVSPI